MAKLNKFGKVVMEGTCEVTKDCVGWMFKKKFQLYSGDKFKFLVVKTQNGKAYSLSYIGIDFPPIKVSNKSFKKYFKINKFKFHYS